MAVVSGCGRNDKVVGDVASQLHIPHLSLEVGAEGEGGGGRGLEVGQPAVDQDRPGGLEEEEEGEEGVEEVADGEVEEEDVAGGGETETAGGQQQDEVGRGGRQEEEVEEEGRACKIVHNTLWTVSILVRRGTLGARGAKWQRMAPTPTYRKV